MTAAPPMTGQEASALRLRLRLRHPGPRAADRRQAVAADLRPIAGRLRAGGVLMDEVAALFAATGCRGGVLFLDGVVCDPFRYVLPALAVDEDHAAFYSATHAPEGRVRIGASTASVGRREGAAFLHCHGRWLAGGREAMGHVLPLDCRLAADAEVTGIGSASAWFEGLHDPETNFTLFSAAGGIGDDGTGGGGTGRDGTGSNRAGRDGTGRDGTEGHGCLLRLRPEEDVVAVVEAVAAAQGLARARVHGIGSICGVAFEGGGRVDCVATEVRIDAGRIEDGAARIDVSVVDTEGGIHAGRLLRGRNPVGVTFEIVIAPA